MVKKTVMIPPWLRRQLRPDELAAIAAAVRQVEVTTNGEIVPMVVRRSTVVGHVFPLLALALALIYSGLGLDHLIARWRAPHPAWIAVDLALLVLLAWRLSVLPFVQRLLTADSDQEAQVLRRAELEFFEAGLNKTQGATGILLFVSLLEHRAVVLADKTIAAKLPSETWGGVVKLMIGGIRQRRLAEGLIAAIGRCGELVKPHFPLQDSDRNELKDALIIKE